MGTSEAEGPCASEHLHAWAGTPTSQPRALCKLSLSEGSWLCPKFPNADPDSGPPPREKKMLASLARSLERLPHGWRLLAPGSAIRFQANFIPLCTRVLGIFHDKVMSSRNEINPTHIFMGNGSFLENN